MSDSKHIGVIGMGYVGLPIALAFAKKYSVIGFDINESKIASLKEGKDPSNELSASNFQGCNITFTHNSDQLGSCNIYVVAVPTPVDKHKVPNLTPLKSASTIVGEQLKEGDIVVYESTVFPGCTEEVCVPILQDASSLKFKQQFKVGYSPERINPGDKKHTLTQIVKVVSGCDQDSLDQIADLYNSIIEAGIHKASSIKVAEAAKIIENTQRDVNIALMNELAIIFDKMDIKTSEVLEAARTKWNFLNFYPGLVGGHCIGVDPYYLTYKAQQLGYNPQVILSGRRINDDTAQFIAKKIVRHLVKRNKNLAETRVLIKGVTFKENVTDIRNSKVFDLIAELKEFSIQVDAMDINADKDEVSSEYDFMLSEKADAPYDVLILAVAHEEYANYDSSGWEKFMVKDGIFFDTKSLYNPNDFNNSITYLSL